MPDELEIIRTIVDAAKRLPTGYSRIGDDVATIPVSGKKVVFKVDLLNRKTDVPPGMTYRQAARKSVAMCVSDFAAKGAIPDSFMVSLGLRRGTTAKLVAELAGGFRDAVREWGAKLVGGDTSEADDLVIDCAMIGFAERIVPRDGAGPGELVVTTGNFGYASAGLDILLHGAKAEAPFRKKAVESVFVPTPKLRVGVALSKYLTSSIDSSDGLAISLHTIAGMSQVGIAIDGLPTKRDVRRFARANGLSVDGLVLGGGEEYLIVGTVKENRFGRAKRAAEAAGGELIAIGRVTKEVGQVVIRRRGLFEPIERIGWTHLS